ncbi:MAG: bifunctional oligoribonuclease/PAP phosphatase NrnA [bacterium]|nr:bifunctional oligoribonuclease/PAP phosphatase NrnA [bacterium]
MIYNRELKEKWHELDKIVTGANNITITTHVNPDGDAVGSELALYRYLKSTGKYVRVINNNIFPYVYEFLNGSLDILEIYRASDVDWIVNSDLLFILDISTLERLGGMEQVVRDSTAKKICIDHHAGNGGFADINITDINACATGELIYEMLKETGGSINMDIAEALYVAILTDTDSFSNSNTTSRTHKVVSELLGYGLDQPKIYKNIYENFTWERTALFKMALSTLKNDIGGRLAWMYVDAEMVENSGAQREEMGGFVEFLMTINDVCLGIFFLEVPGRGTKVSIRSKGEINSHLFARKFGGGGHIHSAGIRKFELDMNKVMNEVLNEAKSVFDHNE